MSKGRSLRSLSNESKNSAYVTYIYLEGDERNQMWWGWKIKETKKGEKIEMIEYNRMMK